MKRTRLQPFSYGLYIDLSGLPDRYRDLARLDAKKSRVSMRFIYSSTSLSMWQMFSCQSSPILIWSEDDRLTLSYYRLISKYLTPTMKEEKAELEMKHILVFGEWYPASNKAMIEAYGAEDVYSKHQKTKEKEEKDQLNYIDPVHSAASTIGRLGGLVKSEAKSSASRANGRKGGRPKSTQSIDMGDI